MKFRTLAALAVAGAFACAGAFAGSAKHGSSFEVASPSSVNESAPWLGNTAHGAGWSQPQSSAMAGTYDIGESYVGAASNIGGSGHGGFDSLSRSNLSGADFSLSGPSAVEYWHWGSESEGVGASSGASGAFDSLSGSFRESS